VSSEARRSPRILAHIPILIAGEGPLYNGVTAVVSRDGAMILVPVSYPIGSKVQIQNLRTGVATYCRIVWDGGEERPGLIKMGVELLEELPDFWGVDYAAELLASPPASKQ
jgi:hypothetical protein